MTALRNASWQHRPSDAPLSWVDQGWVFDGRGNMRRSKLARMRAWLWWFSGTKLGALLYIMLGTCAVYAVCCWFHVVVR